MRQADILKLAFVGALSFFIVGCGDSAKVSGLPAGFVPDPPNQTQTLSAPVERYRLEPMRNGGDQQTALLDTQTGYGWVLAYDQSRGDVFAPVEVKPQQLSPALETSEGHLAVPPTASNVIHYNQQGNRIKKGDSK